MCAERAADSTTDTEAARIRFLSDVEILVASMQEKDAMNCRACGNEERASEGYPCTVCGTFICVMCSFRGIVQCRKCSGESGKPDAPATPAREIPLIDWPEH